MDKTLLELAPISVKPEKDGWYYVTTPDGLKGGILPLQQYYNEQTGWYNHRQVNAAFYLRPLPPPVAEERTFTLAEMRECWDAGVRRQMAYDTYVERGYEMDSPSIEEYFKAKFNITLPE